MGLCIDEQKLKFLGNIYGPNAIFDIYLYEDESLENMPLTLQKSEVEDALWLTKQQVLKLIKANKTKFERALFKIHKLINQFNNQNIIAYSTHMLLTNEQTTKNRPFLVYLHSILCFMIF